jgi:hypothetical protein
VAFKNSCLLEWLTAYFTKELLMRIFLVARYLSILVYLYSFSTAVIAMQRPMSMQEMFQYVNHVAIGTVEKIDSSIERLPTGEVIHRSKIAFKVINAEKGSSPSAISLYGDETVRLGDAPGGRGIVGLSKIRVGKKVRFYFFDPYDTPEYVLAAFEKL